MTGGEMRSGVAMYGRPRSRRTKSVELTPKPTVCPECLTDTEISPCPVDCLTRTEETP